MMWLAKNATVYRKDSAFQASFLVFHSKQSWLISELLVLLLCISNNVVLLTLANNLWRKLVSFSCALRNTGWWVKIFVLNCQMAISSFAENTYMIFSILLLVLRNGFLSDRNNQGNVLRQFSTHCNQCQPLILISNCVAIGLALENSEPFEESRCCSASFCSEQLFTIVFYRTLHI